MRPQTSCPLRALTVAFCAACVTAQDWGTVTIAGMADPKTASVVFENSIVKASYESFCIDESKGEWTAGVRYLATKEKPAYARTNIAGGGSAYVHTNGDGHGVMYSATPVATAADRKAVRMLCRATSGSGTGQDETMTMYRNQPFFKSEMSGNLVHLMDYIWAVQCTVVIYGLEQWKRGISWGDLIYDRGKDGSPGSLSYNGWFIVGVYNKRTGLGVGRLVPSSVNAFRPMSFGLMGFEWWLFGNSLTTYWFPVAGGREEILSFGKQVAAFANGGAMPVPPSISAAIVPLRLAEPVRARDIQPGFMTTLAGRTRPMSAGAGALQPLLPPLRRAEQPMMAPIGRR